MNTPEVIIPIRGHWIGGCEVMGGELQPSFDPSTGRPWLQVAQADAETVDHAIESARLAMQGVWGQATAADRSDALLRLSELILENTDSIARMESLDNGKALWQTRNEVAFTARWYRYYAGVAETIEGRSLQLAGTRHARTIPKPLGVVAVLSPFNGPFSLTSWKVAPALAAGNAVVVKPSPFTPATPLRLAELATEAGFPPGVLNVVNGGAEAGRQLVGHRDVRAVVFTGSTEVGREIAALAARTLKRTMIEAGGKSAFIVFDDADLDRAVESAIVSIFGGAGQSCVAASRMLVQRGIYAEFVSRMHEAMASVRVGDPFAVDTHVGPLSSSHQYERVSAFVDGARAEGLTVIQAELPSGVANCGGYFYPPTLVTGVDNSATISQREVFGPVGVIIPFDADSDAVSIANDTEFGLAAGVWSQDTGRLHRVANQLEVGTVWMNTYRAFHWTLPFGGMKQSGYGRENGLDAIQEFTEVQSQVEDYASSRPLSPFTKQ